MPRRPRRLWIGGIALAVTIAAACTISATVGSSDGNAGGIPGFSAGTGLTARPQQGIPMGLDYGVTLFKASRAAIDKSLDEAVGLGDTWVRVDLPWDGIQPSDSETAHDWSRFDTFVEAANAKGLKLLVTVVDPPIWARVSSCSAQEACAPVSAQAYADFAAAAAARYAKDGVHDWEIWNEENLGAFAGAPDPEKAYTEVLEDASIALHKADPEAVVVLGGLGMVDTVPARDWIGAYRFLSGVARDGGLGYADAIGVHPYGAPYLPADSPVFKEIDSDPHSLESILRQYGRASIPFWITETGATTQGPGPAAADESRATAGATHVTEAWQARIATATVATETADPHIKALFWYSDVDLPASALYYGLMTTSGAQKPAYAALKAAIAAYRSGLR